MSLDETRLFRADYFGLRHLQWQGDGRFAAHKRVTASGRVPPEPGHDALRTPTPDRAKDKKGAPMSSTLFANPLTKGGVRRRLTSSRSHPWPNEGVPT